MWPAATGARVSSSERLPRVALALALIRVVLVGQYDSLVYPLTVVAVSPLGVCGAIGLLLAAGTPLSSTVFIGLILLVGIAANNAIVLVAYVEQLLRRGLAPAEAIRQGATARLRPKLRTGCGGCRG